MIFLRRFFAVFVLSVLAGAASAQSAWIQVEAQPSQTEGEARARAYATAFDNVGGYVLPGGWYAIALGPFTRQEATQRLRSLRAARQIPRDSFIADGRQFRSRFWPQGASIEAAAPRSDAPQSDSAQTPPAPVAAADETPAEARRNERLLSRDERMELQRALEWQGVYGAAIDGDFGPGTRRAMADYQVLAGQEPTGVLTTAQRRDLMDAYRQELARIGLQQIEDARAGIRVQIPAAMVEFSHYDAPFAHYDSKNDSGVQVLLISQPGDQTALAGLYDVMQTLEIVPLEGERALSARSFVLSGQNDTIQSYSFAALRDGAIKGFTLVWPTAEAKTLSRVAQIMRDSFTDTGAAVLSPATTRAQQDIDLIAGLEIRRPVLSQSGFFVSTDGAVLTASGALAQCERITLGDETQASLAASDAGLGLSVLRPEQPLSPLGYARFRSSTPRLNSDVAVAGYSYGDILHQPILTYGQLADLTGLDGEQDRQRLALSALPGDTGGPVFDDGGAVMGVLLARGDGSRQLPGDVNFAATVPAIARFLSTQGMDVQAVDGGDTIAPEDLTHLAADMTVVVNCWN